MTFNQIASHEMKNKLSQFVPIDHRENQIAEFEDKNQQFSEYLEFSFRKQSLRKPILKKRLINSE